MKKILITVPHYYSFGLQGNAAHGSWSGVVENRIAALQELILGIVKNFSGGHYMCISNGQQNVEANSENCYMADILICCIKNMNVIRHLGLRPSLYDFIEVDCRPQLIGFECHKLLRDNIGKYDYYCFMEDDLIIEDQFFFKKLEWFDKCFGSENLLSPNRYEYDSYRSCGKYYIDGDGVPFERDIVGDHVDLYQEFGHQVHFNNSKNPHSGCFFLNERQMEAWAASEHFLDMDISWVGPLESAATYAIARQFRVFKPSLENAAFLELRHHGTSFVRRYGPQRF
jgi:hypothetical protein